MRQLTLPFLWLLMCIVLFGSIASAQIFNEDFNYTVGDSLTSHGWLVSSGGTTNAILTTAPGLTFNYYLSTGIGNAAKMTTTGQDVYKSFAADSVGSVYASFMVKVDTAQAAGDYFIGLSPSTTQTNYYARIFIKSTTGGYLFGLSKNNETPQTYGTTVFSLGTTYVVVVKYTFNTGSTTDDAISVYVIPALSSPLTVEPATPEIGPYTNATKNDVSNIGFVTLRQGSATNAPRLTIDGIHIDSTWSGIFVTPPVNPVYSVGTGNVPSEAGHFATLKAAFDSLSRGFVFSGNTTFYITSDITEPETGGLGIGLACDPTPYTLTFKPYTGVTPTITLQYPSDGNSGPSGACLIGLNGATMAWADIKTTRNIVFDGSNTVGGTTRDLTIQTTGATRNAIPIVIVGDVSGLTFKNCNIYYKPAVVSTSGNLFIGAVMIRSATAANTGTTEKVPSNITFDNNNLSSNFSGVGQNAQGLGGYASAATTAAPANIVLRNNKIEGKRRGVSLYLLGSTDVYNNEIILNQSVADGLTNEAIYGVSTAAASTYNIYNNKISSVASINSTAATSGVAGISIEGDGTFNVYNNMIYGFSLNSVNANKSAYVYGIKNSSAAAVANVSFNSIQMDNLAAIGTGTVNYRGIFISNGTNTVKDNIVANNEDDFASFAIYRPNNGTAGTFSGTLASDYNDFYRTGTTNAKVGFYDAAAAADLAAWKTASSQDANSVSGAAQFISATDLHVNSMASPVSAASNAGTPIAAVTTDIDGTLRDATHPDIGADEFVAIPVGQPALGDYGSVATGSWDSASTWKLYSSNGAFDSTATAAPSSSYNVFVRTGTTVTYQTSSQNCRNLVIQAGGKLQSNATLPTGAVYLKINGPIVQVDGTFGSGPTDALSIETRYDGTITLSGTGVINIAQVRPNSAQSGTMSFVFAANANINYAGTAGTSGAGIYTSRGVQTSSTITINPGVTVNFAAGSHYEMASSTTVLGTMNTTLIVNGTMNLPSSSMILADSARFTSQMKIGPTGIVNIGKKLTPWLPGGGIGLVDVAAGGALNILSGGNADYSNPSAVITGAGTFALQGGSSINTGAPAGLDSVNGPIRTTTRTFNTGASYAYVGTAAQVTGSGLPASVFDLTINDSSGVTLSKSVTVADTLRFTAGKLITSSNSITVLGGIASAGPDKFVDGGLALPVSAVGAKNWQVGQATDYLPFAAFVSSVTGSANVSVAVLDRTVTPPAGPIPDTSKVLRRYYRASKGSGITAFTTDSLTLRYTNADATAQGLREDTLKVYRFGNGQWSKITVQSIDTAANVITVTGVNSFSDFIITGADIAQIPPGTIRQARLAEVGSLVIFEGIATRVKGAFTYMQDTTAGMTIYQPSGAWRDSVTSGAIKPGDKIQVIGKTSQFNGLLEIATTDLAGATVVSRNNPLPTPQLLTLKQFSTVGEDFEAMLVRVVAITVNAAGDTVYRAARTYSITDPSDSSNSVSMRIPNATDSDVDGRKIIPLVTFTGIVGQFASSGVGGYQLMAIDTTDVIDNTLGVKDKYSGIPLVYELHNNYPNPFNPSTTILYGLPQESRVTLKIYSVLGQEVKTLVDDFQSPSYYRMLWNGTNNQGIQVSSGVYFARIVAEPVQGNGQPFVQIIRMLLMK